MGAPSNSTIRSTNSLFPGLSWHSSVLFRDACDLLGCGVASPDAGRDLFIQWRSLLALTGNGIRRRRLIAHFARQHRWPHPSSPSRPCRRGKYLRRREFRPHPRTPGGIHPQQACRRRPPLFMAHAGYRDSKGILQSFR